MGFGVLRAQIVRVVRGDHRNPGFLMNAQNAPVDLRLFGNAVVLQLHVVVLRAEDVAHFERVGLCGVVVAALQLPRQFPGQTGRQRNQSGVTLPQQVHVDARAKVKALRPRRRDQIAQVPVALLVFAQQD